MTKNRRQRIENQTRTRVAQHAHDAAADNVRFVALAVFAAGVFYFFAYYFWGSNWGGALTGG